MNTVLALIEKGAAHKGLSQQETLCLVKSLPELAGNILRRAILVIGYSEDPAYRDAIGQYLNSTNDPLVVAEALKALTIKFRLARDYVSFIKGGLIGYDWDIIGAVQEVCLTAAGYILHDDPKETEIARLLYMHLPVRKSEFVNAVAVGACLIALGMNRSERAHTALEGSSNLFEEFRRTFLPELTDELLNHR